MDEKRIIRRETIARRNAIESDERARRSTCACEELVRVFAEGLPRSARIAVYFALGSEVDLSHFYSLAQAQGWVYAFPVMVEKGDAGNGATMTFWEVPETGQPRAFFEHPAKAISPDNPSLRDCTPVEPQDMDAVIVPMVAFDASNRRLGYGGGNYDRFLPRLREDAIVCGVAFSEQQVERVPTEPHDLPLSRIVVA